MFNAEKTLDVQLVDLLKRMRETEENIDIFTEQFIQQELRLVELTGKKFSQIKKILKEDLCLTQPDRK